ncbi:hypothetical protein QBL02_06365 [Leucobacter sp. UT-8R-CII-1-4]|uniref:hypothetical protein n=1 Tax=Leucobacter sp. UT-8R-CII-1-4 TaxID=3040075 RepID=UPI0024A80D53|nr:hypothetical protein [Leucobacter sp. UT-8R-CII-1-4]MDI6023165.1 hypothetical protein [Leucobacter sp. UT-8R-CII-1-4]
MSIIVIGILACEVSFWLVLAAGLATRYFLGKQKLSTVLLLCVPVLDLLLLSLISWDMLVNGTTADFAHGLGAIYLGFTVAFGHQIITKADVWFSHRFAGGPAPAALPKTGPARVKYEWNQWFRMLGCAVIASVVLLGITFLVGDATRTAELTSWIGRVWIVTAIWFVGWPVWHSVGLALAKPGAATPPSTEPGSGRE